MNRLLVILSLCVSMLAKANEPLASQNVRSEVTSSPQYYSRLLTNPYEEYSFEAIEAKVKAIRASGHPIPTGHPRIFITPSKRAALREKIQQYFLSEMNALVAVADTAYGTSFTALSGQHREPPAQPIILIEALIYQLGEIPGVKLARTPTEYGKDAVRHLTSDAMIQSHYRRSEYLALPLGYDWLYDLMTPTQRQKVATQMLQTAFPESTRILDWNNPPGARLLGAVAIKGDPGVDQTQVNLALDDFYTGMVFGDPKDSDMIKFSQDSNLTLNHIFNAGGPGHEGMVYSSSWRPIYPFLLAWRDQTGEDYFKLPLFQNWPLHFTHSTGNEYEHQDKFAYSQNRPWRQGGTKYTGIFTYLELGLLPSNRHMSALMKYHRRTYSPDVSQRLIYLLLSDPTLEMKSPQELELPKTAHFPVVNSIFSRDSWAGIDSTWLWFQSPTWTNVRDLGPLNDLNIWKHGGMLLTKHEQAHDYDGGNRTNTLVLYDATNPGVTYIPQNVMDRAANRWLGLSFKKGASAKQLSKDLPSYHAGLRYFEDKPEKYLYALGDGGQTFGSVLPTGNMESPPQNVNLEGWSRQLIWFRADSNDNPDHFIVMDRVKKDRNTLREHLRFNFGMNPQIRNRRTNQNLGKGAKEFEGKWNYTNADRIVATNTVTTGWGTAHGRLFIDTLLPRKANYYRMGGVKERNIDIFGNLRTSALEVSGDPGSVSNILKGMWRVQVEPQVNNLENVYLHVMQAVDAKVETPESTLLIESPDLIGTTVANNLALFSAIEKEITSASVTLPAGISGLYRLVVADLSPSIAYTVRIDTTRYNKVASVAGTVYLENIPLQAGDRITISPNVGGMPVAIFTADPVSGKAPLAAQFNASASYDTGGAITSYSWDFGDGSLGTGMTVNHTYSDVGTHTAKLTVTDNDGNKNTTTTTIEVVPRPSSSEPPTAEFTTTINSNIAPATVRFNATSSTDSDGSIVAYKWGFGDGSTGSGAVITHVYVNEGDYTINLTVTDNDNNEDSKQVVVKVVRPPPDSQRPFAGFTTEFVNSRIPPATVRFDASLSSDSDGSIVSYTWDFGDGATGSGMITEHTYNEFGMFLVVLVVEDNEGNFNSAIAFIDVIEPNENLLVPDPETDPQPPVAAFTLDSALGSAPLSVHLDASSSTDADGNIVLYAWQFGDGSVESGVTASHVYKLANTYTITLTVTDNDGNTNSTSQVVQVNDSLEDETLLLHYTFDGDAEDKSGQENHGVVNGPQPELVDSRKSYRFDGVDDYISIQNLLFDSVGAIDAVSICTWVKSAFQGQAYNDNLGLIDFDASEYFSFYVRGIDGKLGFSTSDSTSLSNNFAGKRVVNDGQWHFVCAVYDGTDKVLYVDGTEDNRRTRPHNDRSLGTGVTRYGFIGDGSKASTFDGKRSNSYYTGSIGEMKVFNRALSPDEISSLYDGDPLSLPVSWTVYENAEDNTINGWNKYRNGDIRNIAGGADGSERAIEIIGDVDHDVFRLGQEDGSDWDNSNEFFIEFSVNLTPGSGIIFVQVDTSVGVKYLIYSDGETVKSIDPDFVYVGLGNIADNEWHTISRDLQGDLNTIIPDAQLLRVKSLFVYGSVMLDNIILLDF